MAVSTAKSRSTHRRRMIRRELPFQVALPHLCCTYENFEVLERWSQQQFGRRAECERVRAIWEYGGEDDFRLFCFAAREQAEAFAAHFDGEMFDPERDREGGRVNGAWRRSGGRSMPLRCGPLVLPKFWRENP